MLLAVDTSTRMVGIALYDGSQVLAEMTWSSHSYHTVELAPSVDAMLEKTGISVGELSALGVATGPGSFTALRIGLAFVKGLAFSEHLPIIGIPTLEIVAAAQPFADTQMACVLVAGRRRLAVGWYQVVENKWESMGNLDNLTLDEFAESIREPTRICGELNDEVRQRLGRKYKNVVLASPAFSVRRPAILAELAWQRWEAGHVDNPATLSPTYLHHGEPIPG
ncbi:MAG: tRNA (adenosine(37)-N6)-threonylcarbamoyltransferase complex dimerization subunit type 1 TsaB [Anaerolineales bacterium]|nr:tRNA (adenosine(37)-N6)-threonylcarbamoyltransferase complex dimerization subunit type 1 TsaB [Chloroflexota bacterium]MBL6980236.1 tRNA (adenosine(37)-N6)-threonylcarbamoyltransferase complex dimerization subunit type 1 TsaB [Anaerolineales bacterium]